MKSDILDMDATQIARAIQDGKITSSALVSGYIDHINHFNPHVNAMVENRFEEAKIEADEMDKQEKETRTSPLFGVPISVKEAFNVKGMKTTGGLYRYHDLVAKQDADVVTKLKQAGAIILGKTNIPELCFYQETDNQLYGRTNNPWDVSRTAGGSSGGEGALLAAGGATVGIGSDIGGSIRFPSHFNGVTGFKPGKYQVSPAGHFPRNTAPLQARMLGIGPMGKSVQDMKLMYNVMAHEPAAPRSLDGWQISMLPPDLFPLSDATSEIMTQLNDFLKASFHVQNSIPPYFEDSALLWQEIMSIDGGDAIRQIATAKDRQSMLGQLIKKGLTGRSELHPYLLWALTGAKLFKPSAKRKMLIKQKIEQGDRQLQSYLQKRVLIFPVYRQGALEHGEVYKEIFSIRKTFLRYMPFVAYANVWGLPSLTVPVGTDENDMPVCVQLISINGNEDVLFQLGEMVEQAFGGYVRNKDWD